MDKYVHVPELRDGIRLTHWIAPELARFSTESLTSWGTPQSWAK